MIDYEQIRKNVLDQFSSGLDTTKGIDELVLKISDIAIRATIATLKEYEKQKSNLLKFPYSRLDLVIFISRTPLTDTSS